VHRGDLLTDTTTIASQAPRGATLVIYHSAVMAYLSPAQRVLFGRKVAETGAVWLSNEAPGVLPGSAKASRVRSEFVLVRDGRDVLAYTDPHGSWVEWAG